MLTNQQTNGENHGMPWREKHRPEYISQLIGLGTLKRDIQSWLASNTWPAGLLFAGPPGTGKTTVANIVGNEMNPNASRDSNFYENNASDDRGIGFIRDTIKPMAGIMPMSPAKRKVIFLDEADGLTKPAQDALKRLMEEHSHHTTFILAVNDISAVSKAIQSRCMVYNFAPYTEGDYATLMGVMAREENLPVEWLESYDLLHAATHGDLRQALDILQSTVKEDHALHERLVGMSRDSAQPALSLAGGDYLSLRTEMKAMADKGMSNIGMLRSLHRHVRTLGLDPEDFTSYSVTWGDFVMKASLWPLDSEGFIDYFVASLESARGGKRKTGE